MTAKKTTKSLTEDFDLDSLRLNQDFNEALGVKKVLSHVPVHKPYKTDFFRVHPNEENRIDIGVIEIKETRETFLVPPHMMQERGVCELVVPVRLVTCLNRQNVLFLWPLKLGKDGKTNPWHTSALSAAQKAETHWIRIAADMGLGGYQIFEATAVLPEPEWPEYSFSELVRLGFKDMIVDSPDHPLIQRLTGAV